MRARRLLAGMVPLVVWVAACGGKKPPEKPAAPPGHVSNRCPDMAKADELSAFDFGNEYQLSREAADKLKAAALASMEVVALSEKLDAELGIACAQVAHLLGNKGDWRSGNDACAAAVKAVHDARQKLGAKASMQLVVRQPLCLAEVGSMTKCASLCDSSVPAAKVKADCETKAGRCDGTCDGTCESRSMKCEGTCSGTCEGTIKGTCSGKCNGTCDGKPSRGPCAGVCAGTCDKATQGECKGECKGACKLAKPGICGEGLCVGTCSVELAEPKCAAEFKSPEVSADCKARCEIAVMNHTECTAPVAGLVIAGSKDRETVEAFRTAVDKAFPGLLKILYELGDKGTKRVHNAQAVIEGARSGFKDMARSGSKATAAASEAQLMKCFDEPFKHAAEAAAAMKTGIDQAIGVRDEASK